MPSLGTFACLPLTTGERRSEVDKLKSLLPSTSYYPARNKCVLKTSRNHLNPFATNLLRPSSTASTCVPSQNLKPPAPSPLSWYNLTTPLPSLFSSFFSPFFTASLLFLSRHILHPFLASRFLFNSLLSVIFVSAFLGDWLAHPTFLFLAGERAAQLMSTVVSLNS